MEILFLQNNLWKVYRKLMWLVELGHLVGLLLLKGKNEKFHHYDCNRILSRKLCSSCLPIFLSNFDNVLLVRCNNKRYSTHKRLLLQRRRQEYCRCCLMKRLELELINIAQRIIEGKLCDIHHYVIDVAVSRHAVNYREHTPRRERQCRTSATNSWCDFQGLDFSILLQ